MFPGSTTVNPGTRLVKNPSYPGIADDFRRTFDRLAALKPDIFLAAHASAFDLEGKRARMKTEGVAAFVDPRRLPPPARAEARGLRGRDQGPRASSAVAETDAGVVGVRGAGWSAAGR